MLQVFVEGVPQPQGSKAATIRGGKAVVFETNKNLAKWRKLVTEILEAANAGCEPLEGPVCLEVIFFLPRPKSVKREYPISKPDLDKLIRSINDSATDAGVINGDQQVVEIVAYKFYADEEQPNGALITFSKFIGVS